MAAGAGALAAAAIFSLRVGGPPRIGGQRGVGLHGLTNHRRHLAGVAAAHADDDHVEIRPHDQALSAASGAAVLPAVGASWTRPIRSPVRPGLRGPAGRSGRHRHPVARHDLLAVPLAVVQIEIADFRDVARKKVAVAPAVAAALRIVSPDHAANAERVEQILAAEIDFGRFGGGADQRSPADDSRGCSRRCACRGRTSSGAPARTAPSWASASSAPVPARREVAAIQAGFHAQHIADGDLLLRSSGSAGLRRERRRARADRADESAADGDAGQGGCDGLGDRGQIVRRGGVVGIEVGVGHGVAMADHQQAVDAEVLAADFVDGIRENLRVQPLRFRRCCPPRRRRPILGEGGGRHARAEYPASCVRDYSRSVGRRKDRS